VDATIHDRLVAALKEQAARVEINYPRISAGHIGPFIFSHQADIVRAHLDDALAKGARIECGGEIIDRGGKWLKPTILTGVDHRMLVMTEETFGPVIPVMKFDTVDEGVALANETSYGLSASVFAGDVEEAVAVAQRLDGGAISINDGSLTAMVHEAENDCFRLSGLGRSRMGASGIARYFRKKAILINRGAPADIGDYGEPETMAGKTSMAEQRLASQNS
jgi:acyl-CoA reductase-like NAD-dependent aldehyde dehydrogenase